MGENALLADQHAAGSAREPRGACDQTVHERAFDATGRRRTLDSAASLLVEREGADAWDDPVRPSQSFTRQVMAGPKCHEQKEACVDQIFEKIAAAAPPWLEYQVMCGREMLLSESYLAQPIGEVLRVEHNGEVRAEYNHPIITSPGRGRPRQVDYVLCGASAGELRAGLEVKWVDDSALSKQRIIDDILRLECLKHAPGHNQSAKRYFLVAGSKANLQANFLDLSSNSGSGEGRVPFLPNFLDATSSEWKKIDVQALPTFLQKYFRSFESSYRVQSPKVFRTRLLKDLESGGYRAMLWRVDSGRGQRYTFCATTHWSNVPVPETEADDE